MISLVISWKSDKTRYARWQANIALHTNTLLYSYLFVCIWKWGYMKNIYRKKN